MSDYSVTLSTTEPNNYVGLIKLRQGDVASQSIQATITANGQLFNFDRLAVFFNAVLPNGNVVRDKVTEVDYVNSKLSYIVADSFLQEVAQVTAWFSFENDEKIIDSTKNFKYSVIAGWKECIPQGNYIYELSEIQREIEEIISNKDFSSLLKKINTFSTNYDFLSQTKVNKSELELTNTNLSTQQSRIDQLTRLGEGSTTGDAELIDGRVNANGEVSANIGNAIRNQNRFLEDSINKKVLANGLVPTTLDVAWEAGKYNVNNGATVVNNSMNRTVKFDISGIVELNINNPTNYTLYKYFLYDTNDVFLSYGEVKSKMIINHIGKIAFETAKTGFGIMTEDVATTKSNFIFTSYVSKTDKIDIIEDDLKFFKDKMLVDMDLTVTNGKYFVGSASKDLNQTYFSTQKLTLNNGSILKYTDSKYLRIELVKFNSDTLKCESVTVTNEKNITTNGIYAIQGYVKLNPLTQADIDMILADMKVLNYVSPTNNVPGNLPSNLDSFQKMVGYVPAVNNDTVTTTTTAFDYYKYPFTPIWGHEYLEHWYEKIYDGINNIAIALDGDSITQGYAPLSKVQDAFFGMRDYALKRIMKAGNYDLNKLTIRNNGVGGRNTNEWVGNPTYALSSYLSSYPNGFLHTSMSYNPDLLIIGYGMNDADKNHSMFVGLTLEQRLNLFKTNMEEGLKRIRGNVSVNGRPSYNKSVKDLSIIITLPTMGTVYNTGRTNLEWFQNVRLIIQDLCRRYECAFADFTMRTYAHNDMSIKVWSTLNSDGITHGPIHPNKYSMAQIMSQLQDLIYPVCMWNIDVD